MKYVAYWTGAFVFCFGWSICLTIFVERTKLPLAVITVVGVITSVPLMWKWGQSCGINDRDGSVNKHD